MSLHQPTVADPVWAEVNTFVTQCVRACVDRTAYSEHDLSIAATKLCVWAWETAGFDLEIDVVFRRSVIGHYVATGASEYKPAGRGNLRSQLLRMSEVLLPESVQQRLAPLPPSDPTRPYKPKEIASLLAWAEWQSTAARRANARTLLSLGLGAGLSATEIGHLRIDDIRVDHQGVVAHIVGERARDVPLLRAWESILVDRRQQLAGERWAFRENHTNFYPNLISNFVNRSRVTVVRPQAQRMRTTWLVTHLSAGTPPAVLLAAAGVDSLGALGRYLQFVEPVDELEARSALRGG